MSFPATRSIGELLEALVVAANGHADATTLLHGDATLHRLDGVLLTGRAAVVDAISTHGSEARFRVLSTRVDTILVALEVEGVPGHLRFEMRATMREGRLFEIWMT